MTLDIRRIVEKLGSGYDCFIPEVDAETDEAEEVDIRRLVRGKCRSSHSARPDGRP